MSTYRIAWHAVIEDDSVLEGRSLVNAETEEEAISIMITRKSHEYRLKPHMIRIISIIKIANQSLDANK